VTAKSSARAPKGLGERGRKLWRDVTAVREFGPGDLVLVEEACRTADRLEKLDQLLRGDAEDWVRVREPRHEGDDLVLVIDSALSEARQQGNALRQMLTSLGLTKVGTEQPAKDGLDELASRRANRIPG